MRSVKVVAEALARASRRAALLRSTWAIHDRACSAATCTRPIGCAVAFEDRVRVFPSSPRLPGGVFWPGPVFFAVLPLLCLHSRLGITQLAFGGQCPTVKSAGHQSALADEAKTVLGASPPIARNPRWSVHPHWPALFPWLRGARLDGDQARGPAATRKFPVEIVLFVLLHRLASGYKSQSEKRACPGATPFGHRPGWDAKLAGRRPSRLSESWCARFSHGPRPERARAVLFPDLSEAAGASQASSCGCLVDKLWVVSRLLISQV
jgi:hypothetical protein